jgi:proteasome accessory factor B
MRRIERLINLIAALLETRHPMTAEEIRERIAGYDQASYEAFRRAFERDKDSLRQMGIPLELVPTDPFSEVADGYIIPKDKYYLPDLDLEPDEAAALRLAAETVLGAGGDTATGRLKLSLDDSPASWNNPRLAWAADFSAREPLLGALYSALLERRPVSFGYRAAESGEEQRRTLDPYAIAHGRGHWYVVGRDHERDDVRSFRVDRITSAPETLHGDYEIPRGFDVRDYVRQQPWEIGDEPTTAAVRFDSSWRWWVDQNLSDRPRSEGPEGSVDVQMTVANLERFVSWVIAFGDSVEVLSPPEARAALLRRLEPYLGAGG